MSIKITPAEFTEKHARRLKGAIEDIRTGIERVDKAPSEIAITKQAKMKQHLVESIDNGRWANGLRKVDLASWKASALDKGLGRIASGIDASAAKVTDFASQLLPAVASAQSKVAGMPDLTLEDSINRMTTYIREMSKFTKK